MKTLMTRIFSLIMLLALNFNPIAFAHTNNTNNKGLSASLNNSRDSNVPNNTYVTPQAFWDLYFDFTGDETPGYPKGKINISQTLFQSEMKKNSSLAQQNEGQLILFINSTLYIYNSDRQLELKQLMRTAPNSGFTEMTAISHIGPALMYLAKIKENGDVSWKSQMENLLKDIQAVKVINAQTPNNWLEQVNAPAWKPHLTTIHNMIDYACSMAGNYMSDVLNEKLSFDMASLQNDFLNGNKTYPIPYNNVMIGTFMLTALQSMDQLHSKISQLKIDWSHAKVIIRFVAGSNVSAGVSKGSNWLVPFVQALSNNTLATDRIYITPYAAVKSSLGAQELTQADYNYYNNTVWGARHNRTIIANEVFTNITSIFLPDRPAIPGDYTYSKQPKIEDFLMRLKFSLAEPTEMLSNTVGFWMAGELAEKNWNYNKISIPGITTGFPESISTYPNNNPVIQR
ncbi:DUF5624 domain-containing protein [Legionella pneumophila]|uniref:DUF5624 domain-containing protein n=1 Tax=Legionella pneumophila subsp. pascullei TaxID=91890 RepID=A0AAX2IY60_LEGPN|nr:DUF5624 domain-containing protein [Legionella pneumophila]AMP89386.1 hypothetical protein AXF35_06705 [Legionella pneumophila subsp. pascullei]AMP92948.1 hypothetical protein AXF36_10095 [Legionella pneumophila subsp. pascullei]AMP95914.1 hypothetical protein AXF37_09985 [Legionella pneumophila subsp. pascullei]SQG90838.1 Uncharacterised protein [Legionella pneumophila subsp. pascullei]VEH07383.1 Uncharacterised protein [Legionella pneumophila subsp. pascullei]